ncbi:MAG: hypothetical protein A2Z25_24735 [Planctomycetes bacterium RBG_16_55_9]|nr:MAG: hypothetical protein A2Z25_24735 [Planctomycetes bacterium RBG_16_55_9]
MKGDIDCVLYRREQLVMNGMKYLLSGVCLLAIIVVSGCVVVSDGPFPGPVVVEEIEIGYPPPPPPPVIVTHPPRPSGFHIWIEGHHVIDGGAWVWIGGHWERPPHRHAAWAPGYTRRRGEVWLWAPGRWH